MVVLHNAQIYIRFVEKIKFQYPLKEHPVVHFGA